MDYPGVSISRNSLSSNIIKTHFKTFPNQNEYFRKLTSLRSKETKIRHVKAQAEQTSRVSVREMSSQISQIRKDLEEDEMVASMMAGLRGSNIDQSNFASKNVVMRLVELEEGDEQLPLVYDPETIARFWSRRPVSLCTRVIQLLSVTSGFLSSLLLDLVQGNLKKNEVKRAIEIRNIVTSLGPAYIKLGQALSIRPDILSPAAMVELQKLCDKVPSFDSKIAMDLIRKEFGSDWREIYSELTPEPIAAASLGQVYKGRLKNGETVAVKIQRPHVLETVTVDLYLIRQFGLFLKRFPKISIDVVGLLDEWATRFFEELDYVKEGEHAIRFAEDMKEDLPQVVVPKTFMEYTTRRVLTTEWLDGEKLSQSKADDVGSLVNVGVICYLKQLLDTGFFHADPHPGNLIRTPDGRLAILDFGLMSNIGENIKYGLIEAISHLIHKDYEAIVKDFVNLDFIPEGTNLKPILPVLSKVFDQALAGGGAKNINFQELAADLAQITFDYPFRIPPYFALIIRAISVLEGIALVGNPDFAIVDEAYPYLSKRLLTDDSPRLRAALKYMIYGKTGVFDVERLIDLLLAFENFKFASASSQGSLNTAILNDKNSISLNNKAENIARDQIGPFGGLVPMPNFMNSSMSLSALSIPERFGLKKNYISGSSEIREALKFLFSSDGMVFRKFLMDEAVKSIYALTKEQFRSFVFSLRLQNVLIPNLVPFSNKPFLSLAPTLTSEDAQVILNIKKIIEFLSGGDISRLFAPNRIWEVAGDLGPVLPDIAREVLPEFAQRLSSRIAARAIRDLFT